MFTYLLTYTDLIKNSILGRPSPSPSPAKLDEFGLEYYKSAELS